MQKNREEIQKAKRIVIKIGTSVLTQKGKDLHIPTFERLSREMGRLIQKGLELVLVSSGAIAAGKNRLKIKNSEWTIPQKQAAAAIGQSRLMQTYEQSFAKQRIQLAQILLTQNDLADRTRFLNAKHTLSTLLKNKVLPIINENDSVIVDEIKVGDNDNLSASITSLIDADLLILMTDTEGLYEGNPKTNPQAKLIEIVDQMDQKIFNLASDQAGELGVGGMATKVKAAEKAISFGVPTIIANGFREGILDLILKGESVGTLFVPQKNRLASRKHWIIHTLKPKGSLQIDSGAKKALLESGKSLLPSGILKIKGNFSIGDAVEILDEKNLSLAQGLVSYDSKELEKIKGKNTSEIESILGYKYYDEVIHRDDLVLLKK